MNSFILQNARVVDPANGIDAIGDIGIRDGVFVDPQELSEAVCHDCSGLVVAPGFIDIHVHLRDPGQTHKETLATGTAAAAAGGFTAVVAMPNTSPAIDSPERVAEILARAESEAVVRVLQSACLSCARKGGELTEAAALKAAGAVALTDDGSTIQEATLMLEALKAAKSAGLPVIDHCEDEALCAGGVIHDGCVARELGLPGQSYAVEEVIVARNAILARQTDSAIHIQHLSTAGSVEIVRTAQRLGLKVSAEAGPHHFLLTEEAVREHGANAKMNPPLRTEEDRLAVVAALKDNTIAVIATDHAPHAAEEKGAGLTQAPAGIVGIETAVPLCLTELYHRGLLTLPELIAKFTVGPREVLSLPYGTLSPGAPADVTILDLERESVVDPERFVSKSRNTPFGGWKCRGAVAATIVGGKFVFGEVKHA